MAREESHPPNSGERSGRRGDPLGLSSPGPAAKASPGGFFARGCGGSDRSAAVMLVLPLGSFVRGWSFACFGFVNRFVVPFKKSHTIKPSVA